MFGLKYKGLFYTDNGWKEINSGYLGLYMTGYWGAMIRRNILNKMYMNHVKVHKFTEEELEIIVISRLNGGIWN